MPLCSNCKSLAIVNGQQVSRYLESQQNIDCDRCGGAFGLLDYIDQ